jgi:prevent-host-death family protein
MGFVQRSENPTLPAPPRNGNLRMYCMKLTYPVMTVTQAQSDFPKLCRSARRVLITKRDKPVSVLLPIEDYEAIMETIDILSNPKAMKILRATRSGKLRYKKLDLDDENFGL